MKLITFLMSSKVWISGDSPPWTHRNCWFMSAAKGRQSNASIHESYTCSEYLILPEGGNVNRRLVSLSIQWILKNPFFTQKTQNNWNVLEVNWAKNLYLRGGLTGQTYNVSYRHVFKFKINTAQNHRWFKSFRINSPNINHSPQCFRLHVITEMQREGHKTNNDKHKELLTFLFEGEIFCQMSTFMISTK